MIPTGFAALAVIGAFFVGYGIGKISELRRSQEDIDILTSIVEKHSEEEKDV